MQRRNVRFFFSLTAALVVMLGASPAFSQEIAFDELVAMLQSANSEIQRSSRRAALADLGYQGILDSAQPRLQASIGPLYGVGTRRGSDFTAIENIADFPPAAETTLTHSVGVGLSYQQLLPTAGSLSGGAEARLDISQTGDADPTYSLAPSLSLRASQPLFTNGDVLDFESRTLTLRAAELGREQAAIAAEATRNRLVRQLAGLVVQAVQTRRTIALQQQQIALAEKRLARTRISAQQGGGAESDIVRQEVALGGARAGRLELEAALLEIENQIASLVGQPIDGERLPEELPQVRLDQTDAGSPLSLQAAQLRAQEAVARARLSERTAGATLSMSLTLSPRYQDDREDSTALSGAFTDFSGDGAGVDFQFAANVEVPILEGRSNQIERSRAMLETELAEIDTAEQESATARRIDLLIARRDISVQRQALLEEELRFQTDLIAREQELVEANSSTEELVDAVRLQATALENQIWQIAADIFLTDLEIADLRAHNLSETLVY